MIPSIGDYAARYVKFLVPGAETPWPFKYVGDGVYRQLPVAAKYVGTTKYLQNYNYNGKVVQFNNEKSEKKYQELVTKAVPLTFTQELVDTINENVKKAGYTKVYTIEELNALPEDRKRKAIDCYGTKP
jgi:hypothetical protein